MTAGGVSSTFLLYNDIVTEGEWVWGDGVVSGGNWTTHGNVGSVDGAGLDAAVAELSGGTVEWHHRDPAVKRAQLVCKRHV